MARRPERNFFEQLRRNLPKCGQRLDLVRVENTAHNGTPDVNYCIGGAEGWTELKAWERVRFSGRFTVPKLREEQAVWLARRAKVGGRCYLLCRINKDVALFDGRLAPYLFNKELAVEWNEAKKLATVWLEHPVKWEDLVTALQQPPASDTSMDYRISMFGPRHSVPEDTICDLQNLKTL